MLLHWPVLLILVSGMVASVWLQKLTLAGANCGGIIGFIVFAGAGYTGLFLMAAFFILGTAATAWGKQDKIAKGLAHKKESRRTAAQVFANAGGAALVALAALLYPHQKELLQWMVAAVFSSATADTVSSELGNVYGKRFYNILTFRKDGKGLDGVVSSEGTFAGLAGSLMIATVFSMCSGWNAAAFITIIIAGTVGNISDSILGAALERKGQLENNSVNFINTVIAAFTAALLYVVFKS